MRYSLKSLANVIVIFSLFTAILSTGDADSDGVVMRSLFYGPVIACILTSPFTPSGWSYFEGENEIFVLAVIFSITHLFAVFCPLFLPDERFSYIISAVSLIAWPVAGATLILWAITIQGV